MSKYIPSTPIYNYEDLDEYIDDLFDSIEEDEKKKTEDLDDWLDAEPFTEEGIELLNIMREL